MIVLKKGRGKGGRDKGKKRWKREDRGREGERERKRERERERDTRVYEIYIRGEKFRNDRITFSSFLFFSPVVRESEALHLLEESRIVGPRVFSPRLSLFIIDAVVDIVSSVSSK